MATVLIVDDRVVNREFLATLLGYGDHTILEARDGEEALRVTRQQHPDLVITDVLMPKMDGVEFANALKADIAIAHIPIIFYTATYRLRETQHMAITCGVNTVLSKPAEPSEILKTVAAVLEKSAAESNTIKSHQKAIIESKIPQESIAIPAKENHFHAKDFVVKITDQFSPTLSLRMAAVIELGLDSLSVREPQKLIDLFCRAAANILTSRASAIVLDAQAGVSGLLQWATHHLPGDIASAYIQLNSHSGIFERAEKARLPIRLSIFADDLGLAGDLPKEFGPVKSLLLTPVCTEQNMYGWILILDKTDASSGKVTFFNEEDEQFSLTLAAQLSLAYGNAILLDEVRKHAGDLRLKTVELDEIARQLRISEAKFRRVVEASPNAMLMVDENGKIVLANVMAEQTFGYLRKEIIGLSISKLVHDFFNPDHPNRIPKRFLMPDQPTPNSAIEFCAIRNGGSTFPVEITVNTTETDSGTMLLAAIVNITERKIAQNRIETALIEKTALIEEIHHRVKNNLQVIISLLDMQESFTQDEATIAVLENCKSRLSSMALIHQLSYQHNDYSVVDLCNYIEHLGKLLVSSFQTNRVKLQIVAERGQAHLDLQRAAPCGLLLNELVTNAFKHAYPGSNTGEILVELTAPQSDEVLIRVSDQGVGLPPGFELAQAKSLGLRLVTLLADQLNAQLSVDQVACGTQFSIRFKTRADNKPNRMPRGQ